MPRLTISVTDRTPGGTFDGGIHRRAAKLVAAEQKAAVSAAARATEVTRDSFRYKREIAPPRPGRSSTGGQMKQHLEWGVMKSTGQVAFKRTQADREVPHWIIQEVGTGKRATMKEGGKPNPKGRPAKGATYVRTVRSQVGRRISGGLVFASGGQWTPPGARRDQQLYWASQVRGVPAYRGASTRQAAAIRIRREIRGQHFVKKGGQAGFRQYRGSVLTAARSAFRKSNRP